MNIIDLLLVVVLLLSIWSGVQRGFILATLELLSWLMSIAAGLLLNKPAADALAKATSNQAVWLVPVCFVVIVLVTRFVLDALAFKLLKLMPVQARQSVINKYLGVLPGSINGILWAGALALFMTVMPLPDAYSSRVKQSKVANLLTGKGTGIGKQLANGLSAVMHHAMPYKSATVSEGTVKLPYTVAKPAVRADIEAKMLVLVNKERTQRGLKPLKADPPMTIVSRKHSADMFARGYFSHYTPEGKNPFDRMLRDHILFFAAGENLALAQTLEQAHKGLMESPGHRANILNPAFGRLGIGVLDGGLYGLMITQSFRN